MSTLTLVRHGQAERFQAPQAALSATGEAQARALAAWWRKNGAAFDEVWHGSLPRQARTAQAVAEAMGEGWPSAQCDAAWNEYDATGALRGFGEFTQRTLEAAMYRWLEEAEKAEGVEPWPVFRDRVEGALRRIREGPPSRRVVVFTSGGPIGFAVHRALQSPARSFLDVNWRIRNCSVTEFVFDRSRFTLDSFNAISHLEDAALRTYR